MAFLFDHDELDTNAEAKLVGEFLQSLQDWGDIWSDLDSGQRVEARFSLTGAIKEIEEAGFLVFGLTEPRKLHSGDHALDCPTAVITVVRSSNPGVTELG